MDGTERNGRDERGGFVAVEHGEELMPETEGLGKTGWALLAFLVACIAIVAIFGLAAAIYIGVVSTAAALTILVLLCLGDTRAS